VTTDVPGCREVVADGVNGLLCEVRNAASLAEKLAQMLDMSGAERRAMAERGRQKVAKEFDERVVVETYKDLVQKMTGVLL
jgi:glycosyltransferase involved in cell wall biosynthesis